MKWFHLSLFSIVGVFPLFADEQERPIAMSQTEAHKNNPDEVPYNKEQLWNRWLISHHSTLCELKIPSEALVDYEHLYDFIFHYGDIYVIPLYRIDALSDIEILCLYGILESFFTCYQVIECNPSDNGGKMSDERLESRLYKDLLSRYGFDFYGNEIPGFSQFVRKVAEHIVHPSETFE